MQRFVERLRVALTALSVALLAGYFALVLLQVFYRYVLNDSLFWAEELTVYVLVWTAFIAASAAVRSNDHLTVELLQ